MPLGMCVDDNYYVLPPLEGRSVLEIGCNVGYLATYIVNQKPSRYLGIDNWPPEQDRKELQSLELYDRFQHGDVTNRKTLPYGQHWDVVIMFGVLYHLIEPFQAIINLKDLGCETLVIGTACHPGEGTYLHFEPGYWGDNGNFWYPTKRCLSLMLARLGFIPEVKYIFKESERFGTFHDRVCIHGNRTRI